MINLSPTLILTVKSQITQAPKAQESQDMKPTRHGMHMIMLSLKHLKQVSDEEQKSTYGMRHEQHEKTQDKRHVRYKST